MNPKQGDKNENVRRISMLIIITLVCLVPFIHKAVHMDDPLFIWAAKNIQSDPLNPYGFAVNWYNTVMPMYEVTQNPPLASYYMALTASLFGWSEIALHAAFILPVILFIIGTYLLAAYFCSRPFDAALITLLTPVVLLSSTTLMCDVMMLCFWVWAILLWMKGVLENKRMPLFIAAVLVSCSALTKYFGMNLIPLLFLWTIAERRRLESSLLLILLPLAVLAGYDWETVFLYKKGLLFAAATYAKQVKMIVDNTFLLKSLIGTSFTGGCLFTIIFYTLRLWKRSWLIMQGIVLIAIAILVIQLDTIGSVTVRGPDGIRLGFVIQFSLCALAGINLLAIAIADILQRKDANSLLLTLWVFGTFLFAVLVNWSINGRTLLPMAPAMGILIVRRIEILKKSTLLFPFWKYYLPLVPATVLAILVVYADYNLANTIRKDADKTAARYQSAKNTVWFQGHWGFQYYMELHGCKPIDVQNSSIAPGDVIVRPLNNVNLFPLPEKTMPLHDTLEGRTLPWLSCMNWFTGAGYYSHAIGPLPFVFGVTPAERYEIRIASVASRLQ